MTIRIIRTATLGLPVGVIRTLPAATEAALVADKEAVYDTSPPAASGTAPVTADAAGNLYANGQSFKAAVSGARNLYNLAPNIVLNDTGAGAGTAATPFAFYTVPGSAMGAASLVRGLFNIDWVGGNNKSVHIRVGPASGTWATATQVGGQSGLSSQLWTPQAIVIGNDGATNRQRSTPANARDFFSQQNSNGVLTTIDTTLDWNIWIGVQFGLLNGGDTATLRHVLLELIP